MPGTKQERQVETAMGEGNDQKSPASGRTVVTDIAKENNPAKQRELATNFHQFLTDGNIDIQDHNIYYKHFTALVAFPGTYMTKVTYGHGIGEAGIG